LFGFGAGVIAAEPGSCDALVIQNNSAVPPEVKQTANVVLASGVPFVSGMVRCAGSPLTGVLGSGSVGDLTFPSDEQDVVRASRPGVTVLALCATRAI
jgi:hypothetical protein